jgi:hypothetical protein
MPLMSRAFKAVEDAKVVQIKVANPAKTVQIEASLDPKYESELIDFVRCNMDIFAWSLTEMPGVSQEVIEHTLNIKPDSSPVKHGLRCLNQEKRWAMGEELSRLLAAGFVKEVQHPDWIANLVLVPKKYGKWRMCVDYISLNKACLKDPFRLP